MTGQIPYGKLQQFLKAEQRRLRSAREQSEVVAATRGGKRKAEEEIRGKEGGEGSAPKQARATGPRPQKRWYTRAAMWDMARARDTEERRAAHGELNGIDDLTACEYDECLEKVSKHFMSNPTQRRRGTKTLLLPDMGPRSSAERGGESEAYNGEGGGRVFKWYLRVIYED